jgi:hypothetical protein
MAIEHSIHFEKVLIFVIMFSTPLTTIVIENEQL